MIRNRILGGMAVTAVLAALPGFGQMHKVAKPQKVVRAIGVYEWTGDLAKPKASRFIPVTVFIDDQFEDGGVYVARPIPFALTPGNIYELEDSGLPKGTLELSAAQHLRATNAEGDSLFDDGWLGYGTYHAPPLTASVARLRPSKTLPVITASGGDSGKPHLTDKSDSSSKPNSSASSGTGSGASDDPDRPTMKRRDSGSDSSGSNTGSTSNGGGSASSGSASSTAPANDPDRPTMTRKTDTDSSDGSTTSDNDPERPTLKRRSPEDTKKAQKPSVSVSGGGMALNDDPDRPRLHHNESDAAEKGAAELRGMPADMHQMVGVSDAANRDTHVFARAWEDDTEHAVVLAKMQAFARAQLAAYKAPLVPAVSVASSSSSSSSTGAAPAAAPQAAPAPDSSAVYTKAEQDPGAPTLKRGVPTQPPSVHQNQAQPATAAATPATKTATKTTATTTTGSSRATTGNTRTKKVAAAPAQTALLDEDLRGYTLSYGGDPTFVYMAHTDGVGTAVRYVTVVAQANGLGGGLGDLKVALASVTDAGHLDRTPRLRIIDAVDAEASNRASLLFELRGQSSRQFALYRVIAAKSEQTFETGTTE